MGVGVFVIGLGLGHVMVKGYGCWVMSDVAWVIGDGPWVLGHG